MRGNMQFYNMPIPMGFAERVSVRRKTVIIFGGETMRTLIFVLACLVLVIPCKAETIIVDPNGFGDFDNIQDAINYSSDGDTIEVQPGTYYENVYFYGKAVTLTSTNQNDPNIVAQTIIDGNEAESVITFD